MPKFNLKDGERLYIDNATLNMIFNTYDPTAIKNMLRHVLERQRKAEAKLKNPPNCGSGVIKCGSGVIEESLPQTTGLRPCYAHGKKALFHKWVQRRELISSSIARGGHNGGEVELTLAIVEFENGQACELHPRDIRFADSAGLFKQFAFDEEREAKING